MLRIAKFKLTEVNRNIKYGQLHVSQADKAAKKEEAIKPASIKKEVKSGVTYNIQKWKLKTKMKIRDFLKWKIKKFKNEIFPIKFD